MQCRHMLKGLGQRPLPGDTFGRCNQSPVAAPFRHINRSPHYYDSQLAIPLAARRCHVQHGRSNLGSSSWRAATRARAAPPLDPGQQGGQGPAAGDDGSAPRHIAGPEAHEAHPPDWHVPWNVWTIMQVRMSSFVHAAGGFSTCTCCQAAGAQAPVE